MATTTFSVTCTAGSWTQIAAGGSATTAGLQVSGPAAAAIAVASSPPSVTTANYIVLNGGMQDSISLTLSAGDIVYGMALSGSAVVRGYLS